jgi:hypothetical protein
MSSSSSGATLAAKTTTLSWSPAGPQSRAITKFCPPNLIRQPPVVCLRKKAQSASSRQKEFAKACSPSTETVVAGPSKVSIVFSAAAKAVDQPFTRSHFISAGPWLRARAGCAGKGERRW